MPRLDDPKEYKIIKQVYFGDKKKELPEEVERAITKMKKETNQARWKKPIIKFTKN